MVKVTCAMHAELKNSRKHENIAAEQRKRIGEKLLIIEDT